MTVASPKKPTPAGWQRVTPALFYDDASTAIDWLCRAFGFSVRLLVRGQDGRVEHSELEYGDGLVQVGQTGRRPWCTSPNSAGGNTQSQCVFVDDVDAHCAHARANGAVIATEPMTVDYGSEYWSDRNYEAVDPEGHHWWFIQRLEPGG